MRLTKWPGVSQPPCWDSQSVLSLTILGKNTEEEVVDRKGRKDEGKEGSDHTMGYGEKSSADVVARGDIGIIHPQGTCKKLNDGKVNSGRPVNTLEGNYPFSRSKLKLPRNDSIIREMCLTIYIASLQNPYINVMLTIPSVTVIL